MLPKLCQIPNREEEEEESLVISTFPLFFLFLFLPPPLPKKICPAALGEGRREREREI